MYAILDYRLFRLGYKLDVVNNEIKIKLGTHVPQHFRDVIKNAFECI